MNKRLLTAMLATAAIYSLQRHASANIVVNGDFEGATTVDPNTGDVLPSGWLLGPPSPSSLSKLNISTATNPATFLGPESGTHYARFQSTAANGT